MTPTFHNYKDCQECASHKAQIFKHITFEKSKERLPVKDFMYTFEDSNINY